MRNHYCVFVSNPGESKMQEYRRVFISVTIIITTTTRKDEGGDIDVRAMPIDTLPCWFACDGSRCRRTLTFIIDASPRAFDE